MNKYSLAFIGLGSNLGDPVLQLTSALNELAQLGLSKNLVCAPWYRSKAIGPGDQPDYINTVAQLETRLAPIDLLKALQGIENTHGRQRTIRWGARTLDLDLLLYDNICLNSDELQLPHPEMRTRGFVLLPLHDLAPNLVLPYGGTVSEHLARCDTSDLLPVAHQFINA